MRTLSGIDTPYRAASEAYLPAPSQQTDQDLTAQNKLGPDQLGPFSLFNDPGLDALCLKAQSGNSDIGQAVIRLEQASALLSRTRADSAPQLGLQMGMSHASGPLINAAGAKGDLLQLGAGLSYEIDILHRLSDEIRAKSLDAVARKALVQHTRLLSQAAVATTYFRLRTRDQQVSRLDESLKTYILEKDLTQNRFDHGMVSLLDVERVSYSVEMVRATRISYLQDRERLRQALAVLIGVMPQAFELAPSDSPVSLPQVPAGFPADLLKRRADIEAAEDQMLAAQTRLGIVRKAWMPRLNLSASDGLAGSRLSDLLTVSAQTWGLAALISAPLLDGGRRKAEIAWQDADFRSSVLTYRQGVLLAVAEVSGALSDLEGLRLRADALSSAKASAVRTETLARDRVGRGDLSQLDLLEAERGRLTAEQDLLVVDGERAVQTVNLIAALGGTWDQPAAQIGAQ